MKRRDTSIRMVILSQMRVDNLERIGGAGYSEALKLSEHLDLVVFVCFNNGREIRFKRQTDSMLVYSVPLSITNSLRSTLINLVSGFAMTVVLLLRITEQLKIGLLRAENVILGGTPAMIVHLIKGIPFGLMLLGSEENVIDIRYGRTPLSMSLKFIMGGLKRMLFASSSFVLSVGRRELADSIRHGAKRVGMTSTFVDLDRFQCGKRDRSDRKGVRFLFAGRFESEKGIDVLIRAGKLIGAKEGYRVLFAGDGSYRPLVQRMAQIDSRYRYLGSYSHDEMPEVFCEADVLVLPSYTEGLPAVVLEAMSCGMPVVASGVGEIPFVIRNGVDGLIVMPGSHESLAQAMLRILEEPSIMKHMGQSARERVLAIMTNYVEKHKSLYALAIGNQ